MSKTAASTKAASIKGIIFLGICSLFFPLFAQKTEPEEDVVFRSDVSLVRVDVQVLDQENRTVQGLTLQDFVLREQGKIIPIRNFASEELPLDVLLLLDVSGSMRPHVEHVATAAREALNVLGPDDRVALMVFDRSSRIRMPFRKGQTEILQGFEQLLRQERFNGGTDITLGLLDAAKYVSKNARKEARRAIVILTDDQTQNGRNDGMVLEALANAEAVLSALISPDAMGNMRPFPGGGGSGWPGGNGRQGQTWPGGNRGGVRFPGGVIIGGGGGRNRRGYPGGYPGGGYPGGGYPGGGPVVLVETQSAGTTEIAEGSGGDSIPVHAASSLETTLSRLRQRYSLYFQLPADAKAQQKRNLEITLSDSQSSHLADARLRYQQTYISSSDGVSGTLADTIEYSENTSTEDLTAQKDSVPSTVPEERKRRVAVDENTRSRGPNTNSNERKSPDFFPETVPSTSVSNSSKTESPSTQKKGGWRKVTDPIPSKASSPLQ